MPTLEQLRPIADELGIGHTSKTTKKDLEPLVEEAIGHLEDRADAMGHEATAAVDLADVQALVATVRLAEDNPAPLDIDELLDDDDDELLDEDVASEVGDHVDEVDPRDPAHGNPPARPASRPARRIVGGPPTVYELAAWFPLAAIGDAPDYAGETVTRDVAARAQADGYTPTGAIELEVVKETTDRIRLRALIEVAA